MYKEAVEMRPSRRDLNLVPPELILKIVFFYK